MAIDQRSGKEVNGVVNQIHLEVVKMNKATEYIDTIPDLEAAFSYVKNQIKPDKIIIWGSSYSAALMFYLGSVHGKDIRSYAAKVKCPVFMTSSGKEHKQREGIYDSVTTKKYSFSSNDERR